MAANMRCEKNSLALLSSKRTKAFSKSRADEAFALPSFLDGSPTSSAQSPYRSGRQLKVEHHVNDVEILKQTMLQHESMFKEQLYELHRLYQVQKLLMEESKRKSLVGHPHLDSPPSNSSLAYNPDSCRVKQEHRFWEASNAVRLSSSKQLSFFSGQVDVNKPCEDKHNGDRLTSCKHSQRPIIDLEQPAEEHMEIDVEEEKPLLRNSFFQPVVGNPHPPRASWQDSQCSFLLGKNASITMHEEKSNSICRESTPSSNKWMSFEDRFTPEHSKQKEVPFFPLGSSNTKNYFIDGGNIPSCTTSVTSLFGINLMGEINNRDVQSPAMQSKLDHKRSDACDTLTGQPSKLPHWLLQGLQSTSAANVSPINSVHQRQHQTSPFFLQKQGERTPCFDMNVSSKCAQQEHSDIWAKSGGAFSVGEPFLGAPNRKFSSGCLLDQFPGNVNGVHKLAQASSVNDSIPLLSPSRVGRRLGSSPTSATNHSSSPFILKQSSVSETDAAPAFLIKEFASNLKNNGTPAPPWYQQKAPSSVIPEVPKAGPQNPRTSNAFGNSLSSWVNAPSYEQVQEGIFTKRTQEAGECNLQGTPTFYPTLATRPELSSKRLIFGFMPTASDLDLTLGLDLNDDEALEKMQRAEESFSNEHLVQNHNKAGLQSKPVRNDFDLNEQSGQHVDAESQTIPTSSEHKFEGCIENGWGIPAGLRPPCVDWKTSHNTSSLKAIPEEATASTVTPRQQSVTSFLQTDSHADTPDDGQLHGTRVNGVLVAGRSSDGSGLASCESRSTPIPALTKERDDSTLSGEACQSIAVRQSSQEVLFDSASMVLGKRQGLCSAMPGCSEVYQCDSAGGLLTQNCMLKNSYSPAGNDKAGKGKVEASEAADILLFLSLDLPSTVSENHDDEERALKWLADSIPQNDMSCLNGDMAGSKVKESILRGFEHRLEVIGFGERALDSFELAVLSLKPMDPANETIFIQPIERGDIAEECLPPSNLRRRSLRRGRAGKDFQKEMLPSIASLSRQEITEDLQIIEGLVKSATEAMARCSLSSKEDVSWSLPALSSAKTPGKAKGFRTCKAGKQNGLLRICSWGESTRRRRMRRQRRVCLPLGY